MVALVIALAASTALAQRRITPVTPAPLTRQPVDSALILKRQLDERRARSVHFHDQQGRTILIDTLTNTEWVDSTLLPPPPKMIYPIVQDLTIGVNVFDALMRAFGQDHGIADIWASLSMHNRYFPTLAIGLGQANHHPDDGNYTYHSAVAPYFKLGLDYNFLYNSDPRYRIMAGVRYGFSAFSYRVTDATLSNDYWEQGTLISFPKANVTAGWLEVGLNLRVNIWRGFDAGWGVNYHTILHQTKPPTGNPWYIPGYGTRTSALGVNVNLCWRFSMNKKPVAAVLTEENNN